MTLWLGIMKVGEKGGMVAILAKLVGPFFSKLFPEIPKDLPYVFISSIDGTGLTELTVDQKIMMHKFKMPTGWINFLGNTGLCLTENGKDKTVTQQVCSKEGKNNWKFKKVGKIAQASEQASNT